MPVEKEEVKGLFSNTPYEIKKDGVYGERLTAAISEIIKQELPVAGHIKTKLIFKFSQDKEERNYCLKEKICLSDRTDFILWKVSVDSMEKLQQKTRERFQKE